MMRAKGTKNKTRDIRLVFLREILWFLLSHDGSSQKQRSLHPLGAFGSCNIENSNNIDDESPFFVSKKTDEPNEYYWCK